MLVISTTARALGWSARGKRREGAGTRAGGVEDIPTRAKPARGGADASPRAGRSARAAAKNAQSRSLLQDALPDAVQPPGKGATGEGRPTRSPRGGFDDRGRVQRRHCTPRNAPGRLASTRARARSPEGCVWRDPNASPACAEGNPRVVRKPRNADRATIETRKRRCGGARVPSWKPRTRDARTGTVRAVRNERARRAGEPLETNDFCQFPAKRRKFSRSKRARGRKPISWVLTRRHLSNIAWPNADVGIFLFFYSKRRFSHKVFPKPVCWRIQAGARLSRSARRFRPPAQLLRTRSSPLRRAAR
jgi:hypothetical protein